MQKIPFKSIFIILLLQFFIACTESVNEDIFFTTQSFPVSLNEIDTFNSVIDTQNIETLKYLLKDSIIRVSYQSESQADIFLINKEIEIYKLTEVDILLFNSDSFVRYDNNPNRYVNKTGGKPKTMNFKNDTIILSTHLGGVAIQTWEHLVGIKLP